MSNSANKQTHTASLYELTEEDETCYFKYPKPEEQLTMCTYFGLKLKKFHIGEWDRASRHSARLPRRYKPSAPELLVRFNATCTPTNVYHVLTWFATGDEEALDHGVLRNKIRKAKKIDLVSEESPDEWMTAMKYFTDVTDTRIWAWTPPEVAQLLNIPEMWITPQAQSNDMDFDKPTLFLIQEGSTRYTIHKMFRSRLEVEWYNAMRWAKNEMYELAPGEAEQLKKEEDEKHFG